MSKQIVASLVDEFRDQEEWSLAILPMKERKGWKSLVHASLIPALGRLRLEGCPEFKASLYYIVSSRLARCTQ